MTERLYYTDSYLSRFQAAIVEARGNTAYLDRTAFYPTSGGQLHDLGMLNGVRVTGVAEDEDGRIAHHLESPLAPGPAEGVIDWARRFDFMQQHTGQHLLSAVFESLFGFATVSVHFGEQISTLDLATPALSPEQQRAAEWRANEIVWENRPVMVRFAGAGESGELRKPSEREGTLRIVTIQDLDHSACGGTHVRATGEAGPIVLRRLDKIRGNVRVEFLCGARALRRVRADADVLNETARPLSAAVDELPAAVAALAAEARESGKRLRKAEAELAGYRGRSLYDAAPPNEAGRRVHVERRLKGALDEEIRALAMSFTAQANAAFVAAVEDPPAVLFAASEDSGLNAGAAVKAVLAALGGKGGGNARLAQGSLPGRDTVEEALQRLAPVIGG
jgi:alanyl-tRNA synthetase